MDSYDVSNGADTAVLSHARVTNALHDVRLAVRNLSNRVGRGSIRQVNEWNCVTKVTIGDAMVVTPRYRKLSHGSLRRCFSAAKHRQSGYIAITTIAHTR